MAVIAIAGTSMFAQKVGDPAPDFSYQSLSGDTVKLSDYAGKVVFLFLFGNGCPSCKSIGNDTETLVEAVYGSRDDFQALGLDLWNSTSSVTSVTAFKSTTKISYPLLLKAGDMEQKYSTTYDRLLVIDKEGVLRHKGGTVVSNDLGNAISIIEGLFATTSVGDQAGGDGSPLVSIYPNPVDENAGIHFTLVKEALVDIRIYNLTGQEIIYLGKETIPAGNHMREIPAGDLSSGVYVVRMAISGNVYTRKMLVN
jgi:peroxiredoxin